MPDTVFSWKKNIMASVRVWILFFVKKNVVVIFGMACFFVRNKRYGDLSN